MSSRRKDKTRSGAPKIEVMDVEEPKKDEPAAEPVPEKPPEVKFVAITDDLQTALIDWSAVKRVALTVQQLAPKGVQFGPWDYAALAIWLIKQDKVGIL